MKPTLYSHHGMCQAQKMEGTEGSEKRLYTEARISNPNVSGAQGPPRATANGGPGGAKPPLKNRSASPRRTTAADSSGTRCGRESRAHDQETTVRARRKHCRDTPTRPTRCAVVPL